MLPASPPEAQDAHSQQPDDAGDQGEAESQRAESAAARALALIALLVSIAGFATLAALRDAAQHLNADGIQQSTMSVQNVDLFYWGQDRLAALTSWLASPVGDPDLNLWACLLINGSVFYALLATLARIGVRALTGSRSWLATLIAFLVLATTVRLLFTSRTVYILSLEGQPYAWSHLLALGAFVLWRTRRPAPAVLAVLCVGLTVGLNSAAILTLATLALVAVVLERRRWFTSLLWWGLLGVVCIASQGLWTVLARRFGGEPGPTPEGRLPYFDFSPVAFLDGWQPVLANLLGTLRQPTWIAALALAGFAALSLPDAWRGRLRTVLLVAGMFAAGYGGLFTSNWWVSLNDHHFRYFAPVLFSLLIVVAAPIALWLIGLVTRPDAARTGGLRSPALAGGIAALVAVVGVAVSAGPVRNPNQAYVLEAMQPTADFATEHDIRFISGYYWLMWPVLHGSLDADRDEVFITATKSGGELAAYHEAFAEARRSGSGSVEALCVGWTVGQCQEYLTFWTAPGWQDTGRTCPMASETSLAIQHQLLGNPPERVCRVLVNNQDEPLTRTVG